MGTNQKNERASYVEIDARALLRTINAGALSQHKIFEDKIKRIGEINKAEYRLVSLNPNSLVYEDVGNNQYYLADIKKLKGGNFRIENVREIKIVEEQKGTQFSKGCLDLMESISSGNEKSINEAFDKLGKLHFSAKVVPNSGWVVTRDGVARHINVDEEVANEDIKKRIIDVVTESLSDRVHLKKGQIVEAVFSETGDKFIIPITELTRRKVVARQMKECAENAWSSQGFKTRMGIVASLISNKKIEEAVRGLAEFLKEEQEFCLLNQDETKTLIANTLAANGIMNPNLVEDVSVLFYRTNCNINKVSIIESWMMTAKKASSVSLMSNVKTLAESEKFNDDYNKFLGSVFVEDASTKDVRRNAYLSSLEQLAKVVEGTDDESVIKSINNYVLKLKDANNVDDATLYEVEELLASMSNEIVADVRSLADYDRMPEGGESYPNDFGSSDLTQALPDAQGGLGGGLGGDLGLGTPPAAEPAIPLPIGGDMGAPMGAAPMGAPMGAPTMGAPALAADMNKGGMPAIAEMTVDHLGKVYDDWKQNGNKYFSNINKSVATMTALVDRANNLGNKKLAESFEKLMAKNLLNDNDPYSVDVDFDMNGINREYTSIFEDELRMDELQGKNGVSDTKSQAVSGADSSGTSSNRGAAELPPGGTSMKEKGAKAGKSVESDKTSSAISGVGGNVAKTGKNPSEDAEKMDKLGGKTVVTDGPAHKVSGANAAGAPTSRGAVAGDHKMDSKGGKTVVSASAKEVDGTDAANVPTNAADYSRNPKMDVQGGKSVVANTLTKSDGRGGKGVKVNESIDDWQEPGDPDGILGMDANMGPAGVAREEEDVFGARDVEDIDEAPPISATDLDVVEPASVVSEPEIEPIDDLGAMDEVEEIDLDKKVDRDTIIEPDSIDADVVPVGEDCQHTKAGALHPDAQSNPTTAGAPKKFSGKEHGKRSTHKSEKKEESIDRLISNIASLIEEKDEMAGPAKDPEKEDSRPDGDPVSDCKAEKSDGKSAGKTAGGKSAGSK